MSEYDPVLVAEVPEQALDPEVQAVEELAAERLELEFVALVAESLPVVLVAELLAGLELVVLLVEVELQF